MKYRSLFISAACLALLVAPAYSQDRFGNSLVPQNEARSATQAGRTIPFQKISQDLSNRFGGELVDANLYSDDNGGYYYDVVWIAGDGRRLKIRVDALTGRIIRTQGGD